MSAMSVLPLSIRSHTDCSAGFSAVCGMGDNVAQPAAKRRLQLARQEHQARASRDPASGSWHLVNRITLERVRLPDLADDNEWVVLTSDETGLSYVVDLEGAFDPIWAQDLWTRAVYLDGDGKSIIVDAGGRREAVSDVLRAFSDCKLRLHMGLERSERHLDAYVFDGEQGGSRTWLDLAGLVRVCGFAMKKVAASVRGPTMWIHTHLRAWERWLSQVWPGAAGIRRGMADSSNGQDVDAVVDSESWRVLPHPTVAPHGAIALFSRLACAPTKRGSLGAEEDRQRSEAFVRSLLRLVEWPQQLCIGVVDSAWQPPMFPTASAFVRISLGAGLIFDLRPLREKLARCIDWAGGDAEVMRKAGVISDLLFEGPGALQVDAHMTDLFAKCLAEVPLLPLFAEICRALGSCVELTLCQAHSAAKEDNDPRLGGPGRALQLVQADMKNRDQLNKFFVRYTLAAKHRNEEVGRQIASVAFDASRVSGRNTLVVALVVPDGTLTWCPPQDRDLSSVPDFWWGPAGMTPNCPNTSRIRCPGNSFRKVSWEI